MLRPRYQHARGGSRTLAHDVTLSNVRQGRFVLVRLAGRRRAGALLSAVTRRDRRPPFATVRRVRPPTKLYIPGGVSKLSRLSPGAVSRQLLPKGSRFREAPLEPPVVRFLESHQSKVRIQGTFPAKCSLSMAAAALRLVKLLWARGNSLAR